MSAVNQYVATLLPDIEKNFNEVKKSFDEEAIHDLRVAIKRLRAVSRLVQYFDPESGCKNSIKPFRDIFKAFGGLRDLQVAAMLLNELPEGSNGNLESIRNGIEAEIQEQSALIHHQFQDLQLNITAAMKAFLRDTENVELTRESATLYIEYLRSQTQLKQHRYTSKKWHKKRVNVKFYHHTIELLTFAELYEAEESELKVIRIIETLLGDWHDRIVASAYLKKFQGSEVAVKSLDHQAQALKTSSRIYMRRQFG